jgi:hypothetical protein
MGPKLACGKCGFRAPNNEPVDFRKSVYVRFFKIVRQYSFSKCVLSEFSKSASQLVSFTLKMRLIAETRMTRKNPKIDTRQTHVNPNPKIDTRQTHVNPKNDKT